MKNYAAITGQIYFTDFFYPSAPKFDVEPVYIQKIFFIKCLPRG